jgi:hypothetical protein
LAALPDLMLVRATASLLWRAQRWRRGRAGMAEVTDRLDALAAILDWRATEGGDLVHIVATALPSRPR